jgi:hypothetical protein
MVCVGVITIGRCFVSFIMLTVKCGSTIRTKGIFCVSIATMERRRHIVTLYVHCFVLYEIEFAGLEHVVWISRVGERRYWAGGDGPYLVTVNKAPKF